MPSGPKANALSPPGSRATSRGAAWPHGVDLPQRVGEGQLPDVQMLAGPVERDGVDAGQITRDGADPAVRCTAFHDTADRVGPQEFAGGGYREVVGTTVARADESAVPSGAGVHCRNGFAGEARGEQVAVRSEGDAVRRVQRGAGDQSLDSVAGGGGSVRDSGQGQGKREGERDGAQASNSGQGSSPPRSVPGAACGGPGAALGQSWAALA